MSRAEELALQSENLADARLESDGYEWSVDADVQLRIDAAELRRLSAVEAELAECKAAYELQSKALHALKATLAASCADEREQLWESTPGGGCSRALDAERELIALKKAISEAEPVAIMWRGRDKGPWRFCGALGNWPLDPAVFTETEADPLYTLKGIK